MFRFVFLATISVAVSGCGFIDPDITNFDLSLPKKEFTVDTAQWELSDDPTFPEIPCTDTPTICSTGLSEVCGNEAMCFGSCDGTNCTVKVLISLYQRVDLYEEQPELQTIDDQPLVSVTVDRVAYDITENTLSIDSPELTLYVAPETVLDQGNPQALAVGTVAPIRAETLVTDNEVDMTVEGRNNLRDFMKDYKTKFNIIIGAEVNMSAGDPIPTGLLRAVVNVDAHAGI